MLERVLRSRSFRVVEVSGVVVAEVPGSYGLALYYDKGLLGAGVLAGAVRLAGQAQLPLRLRSSSERASAGPRPLQGGGWLQSADVHNLNVKGNTHSFYPKYLHAEELYNIPLPDLNLELGGETRAWQALHQRLPYS